MKYFCTLSDINYLEKGLAMYNSLLNTCLDEFELHYLCLDDQTFLALLKLTQKHKSFSKIKYWHLQKLEQNDRCIDLFEHKHKYVKNEYISYMDYCFVLASYFTDYLLKYELKNVPEITYIDSDVYFYQNIQYIYDEVGTKSVGIIPHRHITVPQYYGFYNVSIVYFKNNEKGREVLTWWKDAVLNKKYSELSTCGDQKYLDDFIPRFGKENICVITNLSHGAPWNYRLYVYDQFEKTGKVKYGDELQLFVFNHFSKLIINYNTNQVMLDNGIYNDFTLNREIYNFPHIKKLYKDYINILQIIHKQI